MSTPETVVHEPEMGYARPSEEALKQHHERVQKNLPAYQKFLDQIRKNAADKGLTQEILDELLKRDDA